MKRRNRVALRRRGEPAPIQPIGKTYRLAVLRALANGQLQIDRKGAPQSRHLKGLFKRRLIARRRTPRRPHLGEPGRTWVYLTDAGRAALAAAGDAACAAARGEQEKIFRAWIKENGL